MNPRLAEWRVAALAGPDPCGYCNAEPGVPCTDPRTGYQLKYQAAHLVRLKAAGFGDWGVIAPQLPLDDPQPAPDPYPWNTEPRESDHDYYRR